MKGEIVAETVVAYKAMDVEIGPLWVTFTFRPKRKSNHVRRTVGILSFVGMTSDKIKTKSGMTTASEAMLYLRELTTLATVTGTLEESAGMRAITGEGQSLIASTEAFQASEVLKVERKKTSKKTGKKANKRPGRKKRPRK